jgi:hypothetical protein
MNLTMGGRIAPATLEDNSMVRFFQKQEKVLASNSLKRTHPHLLMLRMILQCDYGRPKLVQHLMRTTAINALLDIDSSNGHSDGTSASIVNDFKSRFYFSDPDQGCGKLPIGVNFEDLQINYRTYLPQFIVLTAISAHHSFLQSQEHTEWLRYQHMCDHGEKEKSVSEQSETLISTSKLSSNHLVIEIENLHFGQLLNKSHWIVAFAHMLETLPFPVSILGRDRDAFPPSTSAISQNFSTTVTGATPMVFMYGNESFVQMVGDLREEIAEQPYDKYHSFSPPLHVPASSSPKWEESLSPRLPSSDHAAISEALALETSLRIGTLYYPRSPLTPFLNLQSYLPLRDSDQICNFFLVVHCDIWRHQRDSKYIQRLDVFTEILSKAIIPHRESAFTFLKAYFYHNHSSQNV